MAKVKACAQCGEPFVAVYHQQRFCSQECRHESQWKRHSGWNDVDKLREEKRVQKEARRTAAARRRDRLAARDADYAKHAAPVTVEEREFRDSELGMVIRRVENRGYCPCSSTAGIRRQHVADNGVTCIF